MLKELDDFDWGEVFGDVGCASNQQKVRAALGFTGSTERFTREDVVEIRHITNGENDGEDWRAVGRLIDGRWFFVDGWCDYTGWDCRSGTSAYVSDSYDNLVRWGLGASEREHWGIVLPDHAPKKRRRY